MKSRNYRFSIGLDLILAYSEGQEHISTHLTHTHACSHVREDKQDQESESEQLYLISLTFVVFL